MNIKDIAAMAGTSVATVSRVINCDEHVSEKTRKRILEVIAAAGYKPELTQRALLGKDKEKILILLPGISNPFYAQIVEGIEYRACENGFDTLICITHRDITTERRYIDLVRFGVVKGLVFFTSTIDDNELESVAKDYPVVQCGAFVNNSRYISYSCIDNVMAGQEAVRYLISLGNERIAFIHGTFERPFEVERQRGYLQALASHGIEPCDEYQVLCDYSYSSAFDACRELLQLKLPPTGFFCSNEQMAAGVIKCLTEMGLSAGKDMDVIGFDGTFLAGLCTPSITCMEQPGYEMGRTAFDLLLERIRNKNSIIKKVVLPHKLVVRQSTKKLS